MNFLYFSKNTKIVLVRNQYLPPQMIHNVNDKFVFRTKIYFLNTLLYITFNVMVCIVESTAFQPKLSR